jgi:hypothetical protein
MAGDLGVDVSVLFLRKEIKVIDDPSITGGYRKELKHILP